MFCFKPDTPMSILLRVAEGWLEISGLKMFQLKTYDVYALLSGAMGSPLLMCPIWGKTERFLEETLLASSGKHLCSSMCRGGMAWTPGPSPEAVLARGCLGVRNTDFIFCCTIGSQLAALHMHLFLLQKELNSKLLEDLGILGSVCISWHILSTSYSVTISGRNECTL